MQKLLSDLSLGTLPSAAGDWPIHVFTKQDAPDQCIVIYETAGIIQDRDGWGQKWERYGIQIVCRDLNPTVGRAKASSISNTMDTQVVFKTVTIAATTNQPQAATYRVHSFSRTSPVMDIGDEKPFSKRRQFTLNGTLAVTNIT